MLLFPQYESIRKQSNKVPSKELSDTQIEGLNKKED